MSKDASTTRLFNPEKELRKLATYQTKMLRRKSSLLEKRHGDFTRNNTQVSRVCGLKELKKDPFLLGSEVQIGLS
jgi:hypothetical protein